MKITPQFTQIVLIARCTRWFLTVALIAGALFWVALTWLAAKGQFDGLAQFTGGYMRIGTGLSSDSDGQLVAAHPMLLWGYILFALGITGYGLLRLWRLMRMYEAGGVFDRLTPNHLSAFALCILLRELLDIVAAPLISAAMTGGMSPTNFVIDSGTTHVLLITSLFFLMSRIMAAAYVVAEDNERII